MLSVFQVHIATESRYIVFPGHATRVAHRRDDTFADFFHIHYVSLLCSQFPMSAATESRYIVLYDHASRVVHQ